MKRVKPPGSGRKKGSLNKKTLERERQLARAAEALKAGGVPIYDGDAHALLMSIYKNETAPLELRADAAKAAIRFEKPAKTENVNLNENQFVMLPDGKTMTAAEWQAKYAPRPADQLRPALRVVDGGAQKKEITPQH